MIPLLTFFSLAQNDTLAYITIYSCVVDTMYIQTFQFSLNLIPDFVVILSCHAQYYTLLERALKIVRTNDQDRLHTKVYNYVTRFFSVR